jgi:hypothetical protein
MHRRSFPLHPHAQKSLQSVAAPRSVRERERSFGPAAVASRPVVEIRSVRAVIRPIRMKQFGPGA